MLPAWGRMAVRFRWFIVALWALAAGGSVALDLSIPPAFSDNFQIPNSDTSAALSIFRERYPVEARSTATLVVHTEAGIEAPAVRSRLDPLLAEIGTLPEIAAVGTPYSPSARVSRDGLTALVPIQFDDADERVADSDVRELIDLVVERKSPDLQLELSGRPIQRAEGRQAGQSEAIGLAAALVVLLIAFGSVVAAGLPVATALVGLACGLSAVGLLSHTMEIATAAPTFAAMLGIGVGIDYALFVVTRFRESISGGATVGTAVEVAVSTAGKAVAIAGTAVVIALLGLYLVGIPLIATLGLVAALTVAIAVVIALSLIPAVLAIVGRRIDALSPFAVRRRRPPSRIADGRMYRLTRRIQRFPVPATLACVALLAILSYPLVDAALGVSDAGTEPESSTARRAYDLQAAAFGPGFNGTLTVVVEREPALGMDAVARIRKALAATDGVAAVGAPGRSPDGTTAVLSVVPSTAPQSAETRDLVHRLRSESLPGLLERQTAAPAVYITGPTAAYIDMSERIESRLVPFFAVVVGLSMVLLAISFRSITIPLKAAALNFAAIAAALGVSVAVFQWGWGARLIGIDRTGPIESYMPMFVFAVLFGLSMDYEVFL
ncbi:MAG: MMPL family transporter, partial [Dehalococcoidia bacterium]